VIEHPQPQHHRTFVVSFDMETDIGSWTLEQRGVREGTPHILDVLRCHNIKATFLFTGREAKNNSAVVERILSEGHEIGCHTMYHETVGEEVYDTIFNNHTLPSEVMPRLELATTTVELVAGVRPASFRAPRLFGSTVMANALEQLGYLVDSSFPCYFHSRDFRPYHPAADDWSRAGKMRLLELPLFFDREGPAASKTERRSDQWPMLRLRGAAWFTDLCERAFGNSPILCAYLHPWEFVEMPRSVANGEATINFQPFLYENTGHSAITSLDAFIGSMRDRGVDFMTMRQLHTSLA